MKDEIKEKIDDIFWEVKKHPMDSDYLVKKEEMELLLDYITNLQQETNKLTAESTEWEERTYCWQDRAEDLEIVIDKAIEYIENPRHEMSVLTYQNLLNILQDKEVK